MRKLILFLILATGMGTGVHYSLTGRLPWMTPSPDEQEVETLQASFNSLCQQWKQAGHVAAFGADPTTATDATVAELDRIETTLAGLAPRLQSRQAQVRAERLRQDLAAFKAGMH